MFEQHKEWRVVAPSSEVIRVIDKECCEIGGVVEQGRSVASVCRKPPATG